MERVAYVSTCGSGHLNTLSSRWSRDPASRLFLLRFADEPVPLDNTRNVIVITCNQCRPSEEAAVFNRVRAQALQDALHVWLHDYAPTLIVYDFFCLEARAVSRILGVPAICSIPATLKPDETETCSDAVLPQERYYWIWRDAYPTALAPVAFLGPRVAKPKNALFDAGEANRYGSVTVITFGTVIPYYEGCQSRLINIRVQLYDLVNQDPHTYFIFAGIQGPSCENCESPSNCDLPGIFAATQAECLIFHGGGNTYAEALAARVNRILVCPFFGDQFETARQEGNVYSGDLIKDLYECSPHVYPAEQPIRAKPFTDLFPDYWRSGDLLFGHRRHRETLQLVFPQINLHLGKYARFDTFANPGAGELPAIADVYNDELGLGMGEPPLSTSNHVPYLHRLDQVRKARREMHFLPPEHCLVHHCLEILDLTVHAWHGTIHFVLGPFDELGPATRIELQHIESCWDQLCDAVIFYDLQGRRRPAPFSCPKKVMCSKQQNRLPEMPEATDPLISPLLTIPGRIPLVWGRFKSQASHDEKTKRRHLPVLDTNGWRTGYLNRADLQTVQGAVNPTWNVSVNWCHQKVWYYYYKHHDTELQIWPWTYLYCFYQNQAGIETDMEWQFKLQAAIEGIHQ